jgi:hypothetical protein
VIVPWPKRALFLGPSLACGSNVLNDQSVPRLLVSPVRAKPATLAHKKDKVPLRRIHPRYDVQFMIRKALMKTERR